MAEDLLDEIEDLDPVTVPEDSTETEPSGKIAALKKVLVNKKRLIIILGAALVILLIIAGIAVFLFSGPSEEEAVTAGQPAVSENAGSNQEPAFQDIVTFEAFERLPLKNGSAKEFISLSLSLELMDRRFQMQVYSVEDRIRRIVQNQVRELTWLELRSPEGKIRLKYDLLKSINALFPKAMVRDVYFTNFIMQ